MEIQHLNQTQIAERWSISQRTLEHWRWEGTGPQFLKLGRRVVYRLKEIEAYKETNLSHIQPKQVTYKRSA